MIEEINKQLEQLKKEIDNRHILQTRLDALKSKLNRTKVELKQLENNLEKEKRDVDNLNKASLSNMISSVLGNKSEKIEKEEKEYQISKRKYEDTKSKISRINSDILQTQQSLREISKYETEYKTLMNKKMELIDTTSDKTTKDKLTNIEQDLKRYLKEIEETEESIKIGENLLNEVKKAKNLLKSAKGWSAADMFGGGMLSSMAKHSKIEEVQYQISKVSKLLNSFNKELKDINIIGIGFTDTTKTIDIFFDNIFTDMAVDSHIDKTFERVVTLEAKIESTLKRLKNNNERLANLVISEKREYNDFIDSIK